MAIPVYNEERSVEKVLKTIIDHAGDSEILVIDDGSTDLSRQILYRFDNLHLIRHAHNLGYGQSLIHAFSYALSLGCQQLVTIDCDEQHEPQQIPEFFSKLEEGWDIVSGSRYLNDGRTSGSVPPDRKRINQMITEHINQLTKFGITDSFCGMKGYRVDALKKLELSESGYGLPLQLWLQAFKAGLSVVELPVPLVYVDHFERSFGLGLDNSEQRIQYYWRIIKEETTGWN